MLALLLFGVGLTILLQLISWSLFSSGVNMNESIAANLAQEMTETLRNTTFASIAQQTPAVTVTGFPNFKREVLVSTPSTGLKQITVNIYWNVKGVQNTLSAVSYVSDI